MIIVDGRSFFAKSGKDRAAELIMNLEKINELVSKAEGLEKHYEVKQDKFYIDLSKAIVMPEDKIHEVKELCKKDCEEFEGLEKVFCKQTCDIIGGRLRDAIQEKNKACNQLRESMNGGVQKKMKETDGDVVVVKAEELSDKTYHIEKKRRRMIL